MVKRYSLLVFLLIVSGALGLHVLAQAQGLAHEGRAVSGEAPHYEFTFRYPDNWIQAELEGIPDGGGAVAWLDPDLPADADPLILTSILVARGDSVEQVVNEAGLYTFPVEQFDTAAKTTTLDGRPAAIRSGRLFDGRLTVLVAVRLQANDFALVQAAISTKQTTFENLVTDVAASVSLTNVTGDQGALSDAALARICNYQVTVALTRLEVVNAEEDHSGSDYGFDGDQITLHYGVGVLVNDTQVDMGRAPKNSAIWQGSLRSGQVVTDGLGSVEGYVCDPNFGFQLALTEDDSTVFGKIDTRMGDPKVTPLVQNGKAVEYRNAVELTFTGVTQDSNYEYKISFVVTDTPAQLAVQELTPSPTATNTLVPSATLTPSQTLTASPSPTQTASPTATASNTSLPTDTRPPSQTPSPSMTPSNTATATASPTLDFTKEVAHFSATQTAFSITLTSVIATYTPSPTATPNAQERLIATQTAFAQTQSTFLTSIAPTATSTFTQTPSHTPTRTFTPSRTPTATRTPSPTYTPSLTNTATATDTATMTFTPSNTPTASFTPSPTATSTPVVCPGAQPTRLARGMQGRVLPPRENTLRDSPTRNGAAIGSLAVGTPFTVTDDPVCADGFAWIPVQLDSGTTGWTAEGNGTVYWLEPILEASDVSKDTCVVVATDKVNRRNGPGTNFDNVGTMTAGQRIPVKGQRITGSGFLWWELNDGTWVRDDAVDTEGLCSNVPDA